MLRHFGCLVAVLLFVVTASNNAANAAPTFYSNFASFQAAAANPTPGFEIPLLVETFDTTPLQSSVTSITTTDHSVKIDAASSAISIVANGGGRGLSWTAADPARLLTYTFTIPGSINAFGIFYDGLDAGNSFSIVVGANSMSFTASPSGFAGVIDAAATFSSVSMPTNFDDGVLIFDDLNFGELQQKMTSGGAAPEPASMALFGLTALGMGIGLRRRRKVRPQIDGSAD